MTSITGKIFIDYNVKTGRFEISSPPYMFEAMRIIPNRKWEPKKRIWTAPAFRANIEHIRTRLGHAVFSAEAKARMNQQEEKQNVQIKRFPSHYPFKRTPMIHQGWGLDKMYGMDSVALLMEARTGKTKIAVDYAFAHHIEGDLDSVVVICPNSLKHNWEREFGFNATAPYDIYIYNPDKKKHFEKWSKQSAPFKVLVVAIESFAQGSAPAIIKAYIEAAGKTLGIVDESHKIKNHKSIRSKNIVDLRPVLHKRMILTGTPVSQGYMDLFMQFEFLDPDIIGIGDFYSFRNKYGIMGGFGDKEVIGYQNTDELMEIVSRNVYQVKRADVYLDLPPKMYEVRTVKLSKEQEVIYKQLKSTKRVVQDGKVNEVQSALNLMGRLQEITAGVMSYQNPKYDEYADKRRFIIKEVDGVKVSERNPDYDEFADKRKYLHEEIVCENPKIKELLEICDEEEGSIVIWALYDIEVQAITKALQDKYGVDQVVGVYGAIDNATRDHNVYQLFQKKLARFLVGCAAVAGVGLEMSAAETHVYMTNSFSFIDRSQSEDRSSSVQQKKSVKIIDIIAEGTTDEVVKEALDMKLDVAEYVSRQIKEIHARLSLDPSSV